MDQDTLAKLQKNAVELRKQSTQAWNAYLGTVAFEETDNIFAGDPEALQWCIGAYQGELNNARMLIWYLTKDK